MQFKDVLVDAAFKQKLVDLAREGRSAHAQFFLAQPGSHALALAVALGSTSAARIRASTTPAVSARRANSSPNCRIPTCTSTFPTARRNQ